MYLIGTLKEVDDSSGLTTGMLWIVTLSLSIRFESLLIASTTSKFVSSGGWRWSIVVISRVIVNPIPDWRGVYVPSFWRAFIINRSCFMVMGLKYVVFCSYDGIHCLSYTTKLLDPEMFLSRGTRRRSWAVRSLRICPEVGTSRHRTSMYWFVDVPTLVA